RTASGSGSPPGWSLSPSTRRSTASAAGSRATSRPPTSSSRTSAPPSTILGTRPFVDRERIGVIGMCGSGALSLSAAQIDRRIKAVAPVVMYDHHRLYSEGFRNSLTEDQRNDLLDAHAQQRYA